jgi:small conductance mechanosensitive channel
MDTELVVTEASKYKDMIIVYASEYGLSLIAAILTFVIGKWLAGKITKYTKKLMEKAKIDKTLVEFGSNVIYFTLLLMVILASLSALGINTTSFIAVFGAASVAVALALQGSLSNVGAAVIIILFRPFKVGDFIDAGGASGTVEEINLFLAPLDNRTIIVPNSSIVGGNITNFSNKENRRVDHVFGIGYGDDLRVAKDILMDILVSDERVLKEPAPFVAVSELGDSSVNITTRAWVNSADFWNVHFEQIEKVKLAFDEKGISIPFPQMDVHHDK